MFSFFFFFKKILHVVSAFAEKNTFANGYELIINLAECKRQEVCIFVIFLETIIEQIKGICIPNKCVHYSRFRWWLISKK